MGGVKQEEMKMVTCHSQSAVGSPSSWCPSIALLCGFATEVFLYVVTRLPVLALMLGTGYGKKWSRSP